jgi:pyruvate dehydrogenase E1 component alpha subunit
LDEAAALRSMMLIRAFEAALIARPDHGFQLLSSGEEAVAVGLCANLAPHDMLLSSGRSIGPALARGLDPGAVMAELLGREAGPCKGRGGRGHLAQPSAGFFGAHAVVAGNIGVAVGVALAARQRGDGSIVACLFGDGACGSGALHEALNIATLWRLPLLFVCSNNGYSVSTRARAALAPERLADFALPFGIPARTVDGMEVLDVAEAAFDLTAAVRDGGGPAFLECVSQRFSTHSTSTKETRGAEELAGFEAACPIRRASARLAPDVVARAQAEADAAVAAAIAFAEASPFPNPAEAFADVG